LSNVESLANRDNLIYKIASYIQTQFNVRYGVTAELFKRIPIAAGLGGGSSNAAVTIRCLSELWNLNLPETEMHKIASVFGSDINFFLLAGCALGSGRGELVTPLSCPQEDNIVLVNPGFPISSGEAYSLASLNKDRDHSGFNEKALELFLSEWNISDSFNDLEPAIRKKYSQIDEIIIQLESLGVSAMLSGSGPTIIGYCDTQDHAVEVAEIFNDLKLWTYVGFTTKSHQVV